MSTPHIEAEKGDIADIVIMPGDPLRAKLIADTYLTNVKQVNRVRNMLGYTGEYKRRSAGEDSSKLVTQAGQGEDSCNKGTRITVMGSGMGMPSMGIYCYELYKVYDVKKIIRVGSCGGYREDVKMLDIILAERSYTESNFAYTFNNNTTKIVKASIDLTNKIEEKAKEMGVNIHKGTIICADCFDQYVPNMQDVLDRAPKDIELIAKEMESFALFYIAKTLNKEAACLATVVDLRHDKKAVASIEEREKSLNNMIKIALEAAVI